MEPLRALQSRGREVVFVAPDRDGVIAPDAVEDALTAETAFVSIMTASNEVGVLNNIPEIVTRVRRRAPNALVHTDAAQLLGKGEVSFDSIGVDLLTLSGHKLGALSGVGALVAREDLHLPPFVRGGPQEGKVRGGTENVLGIATLGAVAEALRWDLPTRIESMRRIRDEFERAVVTSVHGCAINAAQRERLPNTSSVFIPGVRADDLVVAMDLEGVLISSGAACSSGKPEPSHVLLAMGQGEERVRSTVRVSFRADHPSGMGERVAEVLSRAVARMRGVASSAVKGA
jgi:cysteine desulfurase